MLTLVAQDGSNREVDTTKLEEAVPVLLYNEVNGEVVDFDPVNDLANARFVIYFADGSEEEFNWADQSDDALYDISQLDDPM